MNPVRLPFRDRTEAGRALGAALLERYRGRKDLLVLALPRGGVPVACEAAAALEAPVDLMIVRKLGVPGQEELAMGAVASGGARLLNEDIVAMAGISQAEIESATRVQRVEIERRESAYRGSRPPPLVSDRCVILVDDGIATGATMRVAIQALRQRGASRIVAAIPVAPAESIAVLRQEADDVVCLATPWPFHAVGSAYADFRQVPDEEVRSQLERVWRAGTAESGAS